MTTAAINGFLTALRARLEQGALDYGDRSFERPTLLTVDEILQELLDVAGWAFVLREQVRQRLPGVATAGLCIEKLQAENVRLREQVEALKRCPDSYQTMVRRHEERVRNRDTLREAGVDDPCAEGRCNCVVKE